MKKILLHLLAAMALSSACFAAALSKAEQKTIIEDIESMMALFEKGDAKGLLDRTHESIYALTDGRENFEKLTRDAVAQMLRLDVKFLESKTGTPTEVYPAGKYEVCFVPRVSIMAFQGKKARSIGFMIAARTKGETQWKYLDGSGLRKNPSLLGILFPDLAKDTPLPENKLEQL